MRFRTFVAMTGLAIAVLTVAAQGLSAAATATDTRVSVGSPSSPFPRNKQNEPAVAMDAHSPMVLAAGANDEIDIAPCGTAEATSDRPCPFTSGVGTSGIYFSFDGGRTWTQPTYTGYTARDGSPGRGPIGTLPWYVESGLESDGDPALAFGPRPGSGGFSWANGSRLYYANLTSSFPTNPALKGYEAIAVSRTDDPRTAAAGGRAGKRAWMRPVLATQRQSATTFSDHEQIWADNAATSKHFGNVYVCWADFRSQQAAGPEPIKVASSRDGGDTWLERQISQAANTGVASGRAGGRQDCTLRTDSEGVLYVFWDGSLMNRDVMFMSRSFDGGMSFERPRAVATFSQTGRVDPATGDLTFDGVNGARDGSFPTVDIANGAPSGRRAPDTIFLGWSDARNGLNHEQVLIQYSGNKGVTWSRPAKASQGADRPVFPAVAASPNGRDVYLTYDAFLDPWRTTNFTPRRMQGVVRHADFGAGGFSSWTTLHRGALGDARGSTANALSGEFLGDYNYAAASRTYAVAVWVDVRNAAVCAAENRYRQSLLTDSPVETPFPPTDCPARFGNSDIFGGHFADPTA